MQHILLVEDDRSIVKNLTLLLTQENYRVTGVTGQAAAVLAMERDLPDLVLLDLNLEEGNGFAVCTAARRLAVPVIILTASDDEQSVVTGFDMGAYDYIGKPFRPMELLSRIKSVLRRTGKAPVQLTLGAVTVDLERGRVERDGAEIGLSATEYRLLLVLLNHKGALLTRSQLLEELWDSAGEFVSDNTLTVYIKRLREKIERDPANPTAVKTVRGLGYKIGE